MKHKEWKVLQSFENDMEDRCVDFFVRSNGTYGFEEYRRDREDDEGWKKMGQYSGTMFSTIDAAKESAKYMIGWLPSSNL